MHLAEQDQVPDPNPPNPWDARLAFANDVPFQNNWGGVCANYMGFAAFPELDLDLAEQEAEFDRAELSGIKMARTWFDFGWFLPDYPDGTPDWNSLDMECFYTWLEAMETRNIDVVLTMGWHFPGNVCSLTRESIPGCTPSTDDETVWKEAVSESLNQIINVRGYDNVKACFFFTEPPNTTANIPPGYEEHDYYAHLVRIAREQIIVDDLSRTPILPRIKLMGAEEFSFTSFPYMAYLRANDDDIFDAYTAHSYCQSPSFPPLSVVASACYGYQDWIDLFTTAVETAAPKEYWADECGTLVGGDNDATNYRKTADWGWQLVRQVDGHMQAGATRSFPWMLQDQRFFMDADIFLEYGVAGFIGDSNAVHPSWYAFSLHANLTGGGPGTSLYRCSVSGAAENTVHGTGVFIPFGLRHTVNPAGEWTFVIINEHNAADIEIDLASTIGDRTVYRYDYSGEMPPADAVNPAYIKPWTRTYTNITTSFPSMRIPGHSVVLLSTMNISAPVSVNLALTAVASSDSVGGGEPGNVNDGNWTNVTGTQNGWRKADNDPHYVQLTWDGLQVMTRIDLAFVGTTVGVVYADYLTPATPNPVQDYTLEYWNGSTWVELADVTGNLEPNVSHTFAEISTDRIRLNVLSVASTGQVNQIGAYSV